MAHPAGGTDRVRERNLGARIDLDNTDLYPFDLGASPGVFFQDRLDAHELTQRLCANTLLTVSRGFVGRNTANKVRKPANGVIPHTAC